MGLTLVLGHMMETGRIILLVCIVVFTALAAVCDVRTKKLPNALTVPAFVAAIIFHLCYGLVTAGFGGAGHQLLFALGGFATGFGILLVLWLIGSGGGGDVKFMGALGAWLGPVLTVEVFLVSAAIVVLGAMGVLVWEFCRLGIRRSRERYLESRGPGAGSPERRTRRRLMPFGVPAALATWLVLVVTEVVGR